mgnify:FL=1
MRALRQAGREGEARALLAALPAHLDVEALDGPFPQYAGSPIVPGDNLHYWCVLRFYRGDASAGELLDPKAWGEQWPTVAHGVAAWWMVEGRKAEARALLEEIVADPHWARLGHVAAEADLGRLRGGDPAFPSGSR